MAFSADKPPLKVIEEVMLLSNYLIKMQVTKEHANRYRCSMQIININSFSGIGINEINAKESTALSAVEYFKDFVDLSRLKRCPK